MKINENLIIDENLEIILIELQKQLQAMNIPYLQKIRDSGNNIMVQCPYHGNGQERKPSAGVHKETGVFHCFACGQIHSLPEVVSYCFGYHGDFGEYGKRWLISNFLYVRKEERKGVKLNLERDNIPNKGDVLDSDNNNQPNYVSEEELDSYRYSHNYWAKRGITDEYIIELFDLGYDKKTNCITFPVRDMQGNCLFVARRNVEKKWFNYPKDVEKPLYGLYEMKLDDVRCGKNTKLYITESMIDCLLLWQAGNYAVALNGTGSADQTEKLKTLPIRHYVLATDNDKAGKLARRKLRNALPNKLITEIDFPNGIKDIGECTGEQIQNIDEWEVF